MPDIERVGIIVVRQSLDKETDLLVSQDVKHGYCVSNIPLLVLEALIYDVLCMWAGSDIEY